MKRLLAALADLEKGRGDHHPGTPAESRPQVEAHLDAHRGIFGVAALPW